ncbi:helix-turn-helix transcriptional regulator [Hoeflea sp.]|uniref:helix-turn-helix transcriptional regulator n=1 Tax=Hoeflea sp. TaxID=1940281 RepID=UPI002AFF7CB9|nr:helix-turn-helix transcriptional regulator [Hoeflea sp.]
MKSFASAGLLNLVQRVIGAVDPELIAGEAMSDPFARGIAPARSKRNLVDRAMEKHGPGLLLSVGQHLHLIGDTPVATVFRRSADPHVLADKWRRLERYHHAFHRIKIAPLGDEGWDCRRYGITSKPTIGENCLVAGVLVGLVEMIGATDCRLQVDGSEWRAAGLRKAELPRGATLETFRIVWAPFQQRERPALADEPATAVNMADRLADLLATDVGRSWKIAHAATRMAVSTRSLQRHLAAEKRSFSTVLRRARMRQATQLLTGTATPLAEIGYCCGYADQAHFQRDFRRVTNITPKRFRDMAGAFLPGAKIQ